MHHRRSPGEARDRVDRERADAAGRRRRPRGRAARRGRAAPRARRARRVVGDLEAAVGLAERRARDVADPQQREPLERAVGADEVLDERVRRVQQQLGGRRVLGELAAHLQDRDPVAHLDRLVDVVGDEDDRLADLGLQAQELVLQALAVDRVDRAERLVHQHQRRVGGERAGHADALALAAGELRRVARRASPAAGRSGRAAPRRARAMRCLSQPSSRGTVAMLSPIVRCGNRPICWIT